MEHFKKRTLALVLASVVTVVGAFGAENYKNSLMSLKFENSTDGTVNMTLLTKRNYEQTITPIKRNNNTYIIMLPETNSKMSAQPQLNGNIESVDIRTMPYTTNSKGYTKITIKTSANTQLNAQKALYIADKNATATPPPQADRASDAQMKAQALSSMSRAASRQGIDNRRDYSQQRSSRKPRPETIHSRSGVDQTNPVDIRETMKQFEPSSGMENQSERVVEDEENNTTNVQAEETPVAIDNPTSSVQQGNRNSNSSEITLLILGSVLVLIICVYLFIRGKNKMAEVLGGHETFEIDDDSESKKKKKKEKKSKPEKKIHTTIKKLDKKYVQPAKINAIQPEATYATAPMQDDSYSDNTEEAEKTVVDLDELFQEKTKQENIQTESGEAAAFESVASEDEEENSALEEFLSSFSFTDEQSEEEAAEEPLYNEELFNKFINDDNLRFTKADIEKINELLNSEISDDTMKNLEQFIVTNQVEKKPSHREILENFVTSYTINQDVTFTSQDIDALNKLMNVEIDPEFVHDLHTNPIRMQEMQKEITERKVKPHKTSEILTLNVKDMLPNLSEALKKQGSKKIESEVKPQVVYYSEGYDVSTLSLKEALPDLSKEINNADAYKSRPSDEVQLALSGYDVQKMSVSGELPDLEDALMHPEKYETKTNSTVEVDEEALLKNISNVTFKPFYDGSEEFEVINDIEPSNAPSVSDIQQEFSEFDKSFEIIDDEEEIQPEKDNDINDFESLYDNTYVDFDKNLDDIEQATTVKETKIENKPETTMPVRTSRSADTDKLLQFIEEKRKERQQKQENRILAQTKTPENKQEEARERVEDNSDDIIPSQPAETCIIDNEEYNIVSKANFTKATGCYLVKNSSGYEIAGFIGNNVFKLKHYDNLNSEKMQARASEKLDNGLTRYIIRIGAHKLILNGSLYKIEYVMDLC